MSQWSHRQPKSLAYSSARAQLALALGMLWSPSCNEFPEELQENIDASDSHGAHQTGSLQQAADFCAPEAEVPVMASGHDFLQVPVMALTNDLSDLAGCGLARELDERDGFLAVDMKKGERWHVRVKEAVGHDIALYVLPECDERTCLVAGDHCPGSSPEHFNFVPEQSGRYLVGIDGISDDDDAAPTLELAVMKPTCGDGDKAHAEVCDDGNTEAGDGCDAQCRAEFEGGEADEIEPNNDVHTANVLVGGDEEVKITGQLGGACDADVYAFRLETGQHVELEVSDAFGLPCEGAPPLMLDLQDASGRTVASANTDDGSCPKAFVEDELANLLETGQFRVRLMAAQQSSIFDYQLRVVRHDDAGHDEE